MKSELQRLFWIAGLSVGLCASAPAGQRVTKANPNPPAVPQAKITQPATHFTQGTIASIDANQMVVTRKVRGKAQQTAFALTSQTQLTGSLANGARVSVQYHEDRSQKIALAVRELSPKAEVKPDNTVVKSRSKG